MALPQTIKVTPKAKRTLPDGNVLVAFKVDAAGVGIRGYVRFVMTAAAAADFAVDTQVDAVMSAT